MTTEPGLVRYELDDWVATVTMTFAPHNRVDSPLLGAVVEALRRAERESARAVILRSGLRHFSAGAELSLFENHARRLRGEVDLLAYLEALEAIRLPVIASVHGVALGGGFELALACDLIVAAESAKFGMVEVTLGLHPLMGGIQRVAARAGIGRARQMALLGRRYDASTLERWGVVDTVVAEAHLDAVTRTLAEELAAGPTVANAATKSVLAAWTAGGVKAADQAMAGAQQAIYDSHDLELGLQSFRVSGPGHAVFTGR